MNYTVKNLRELLCRSAEKYKNNTAFILRDSGDALYNVSYGQFKTDVERLSVALDEASYRDKHIAIYMKNCYEWCVAYFAVAGNVGVCVPIDKELKEGEFFNICEQAKVQAVVTDKEGAEMILKGNERLKDLLVICTEEVIGENVTGFKELLKDGENHIKNGSSDILTREIDENKPAILLFTSGTTGVMKGVMLSNKNICSDVENTCCYAKTLESDVSLSILPMHHTYEMMTELLILFGGGAIGYSRGLRYLAKDFEEIRPTFFVTVPLMLEKIHKRITDKMRDDGKRAKAKLVTKISSLIPKESRMKIFSDIHNFFGGRLRAVIVGAAPLQKEVAEDFISFGIPVIIGYGLTECSPIVICNKLDEPTADSVGAALPDAEVKIVNEDENGIGEICVKGPMVMLGYYKNEGATNSVLANGFLHTGDLGYMDKNGNYHITGRIKNIIVTKNGKNIYPEEIELHLLKHSVVEECVVFSDDGEIVEAEIYPNEERIAKKLKKTSVTKEDIASQIKLAVRLVNSSLPSYKRIKKVTLRKSEFKKTSTHKIKRK